MDRPLAHKTAIVTGALGLLGREHCHALAEAGANIVATDLSQLGVEFLAEELEQRHAVRALGVAADVRARRTLQTLKDAALEAFARIDVLVNNAAIDDKFQDPELALEQSRFENYPLESWQRILDVNLTGAFNCCQLLAPAMAAQGSGSIINIASTYGLVAPQNSLYHDENGRQRFYKSPAYAASKGGLIQLTRFLAAYYGEHGVRANALCPGGVENGQDTTFRTAYASRTPLGRMASPGDFRGALTFLASDASRYMTGAALVVDGGFTAW
jgi:NAD(P)-dependent dehydrogenase (short-subunit alcohol dehydrogenase family)